MSLDRYRRPRLVVLPPSATAHEAARAMADQHVGAVLVGQDRTLLGLLTDRDLALEVVGGALEPQGTVIRDLMSVEVVTLDVGASPEDAARTMRDHAVRRLPVMEDGIPVGLVTLDDLLLDGEVDPALLRAIVVAQVEATLPPNAGQRDVTDARVRSRMRRRARAENTYGRLLHAVERSTGLRERARAERALSVVLGALCRRLMPQEAQHFIAQLPSKLHPELIECLDGPDKRITLATVQTELGRELGLGPETTAEVLFGLCEAVADGISTGEIESVRGQLPNGMKELFPRIPYRRVG